MAQDGQMQGIVGTWDVRLRTPIGSVDVVYTFADRGGALAGTAATDREEVRLHEIAVRSDPDGERVTWRQSVTKPLRLNLDFDVVVSGAALNGYSRAGRLPRSGVSGVRRS